MNDLSTKTTKELQIMYNLPISPKAKAIIKAELDKRSSTTKISVTQPSTTSTTSTPLATKPTTTTSTEVAKTTKVDESVSQTSTSDAPSEEGFFAKNKKIIIIVGSLLATTLIGVIVYKKFIQK